MKVTAPGFALDASGSLGGAIVASKWKGRQYFRTLVTPHNPQSAAQTAVRAMMKFLSQQWAGIATADQADWQPLADQRVISPFNAFVSFNQRNWRDFIAPSQVLPATRSGTIATIGTPTAVESQGRITTVSIPISAAEDGWGVAVFRSTTNGFTTSPVNLIAVLPVDGTNTLTLIDEVGQDPVQYYNFRGITEDGLLGAEDGQINNSSE